MDKFKLFIVLLLLGYGGYYSWKYFTAPGGQRLPYPVDREERARMAEAAEEGGTKTQSPSEQLPPLAQHHQDLRAVSALVLGPLKTGTASQTARLQGIWDRSRTDFQQGQLDETDARVLADLIRQLNLMEQDRQLYLSRLRDLDKIKASPLDEGLSVEQKRAFAEKELMRQWQELVRVNQAKLQPLFASLPE